MHFEGGQRGFPCPLKPQLLQVCFLSCRDLCRLPFVCRSRGLFFHSFCCFKFSSGVFLRTLRDRSSLLFLLGERRERETSARNCLISYRSCANYVSRSHASCFVKQNVCMQIKFFELYIFGESCTCIATTPPFIS